MTQFEKARSLFPGLKDSIFLDAACVSLAPLTAKQEIMRFLDMTLTCRACDASFHHIAMDEWRQKTVQEAATLFRINPDLVALIESTTHGLNIAAILTPSLKK